jgi:colicin import membrane protein
VEAPSPPDPQIAIDKAKREEAKRAKAEQEEEEREKQRVAQAQKNAEKLKAEKDRADREKAEKAEAAKSAAAREANLKRMQGLAGASGGPTDTGAAPRSSGPSSSYGGRVLAALRPNIVLTDPVDGNPQAVVQVRLAPDGTVISKRLLQSSGSKVWDDAVLRAIERTEVLPRDTDGRAPPQFEIGFRPRD